MRQGTEVGKLGHPKLESCPPWSRQWPCDSDPHAPSIRGVSRYPRHVVDGPTPGTGKSYLVRIASAIVLGHSCAVIFYRNNYEFDKTLTANIVSGVPFACI